MKDLEGDCQNNKKLLKRNISPNVKSNVLRPLWKNISNKVSTNLVTKKRGDGTFIETIYRLNIRSCNILNPTLF